MPKSTDSIPYREQVNWFNPGQQKVPEQMASGKRCSLRYIGWPVPGKSGVLFLSSRNLYHLWSMMSQTFNRLELSRKITRHTADSFLSSFTTHSSFKSITGFGFLLLNLRLVF
ncbi:hypothetical protein RRG08_055698 [Elysia crispata]|uniref:Uncharacterized protein n=1 Tax=Elysia crispata TaxID=231223 RepID=A0AAE1AZP9_9GAST|nr:hypothetical protein RRG08_055698 [Elysia crispata]